MCAAAAAAGVTALAGVSAAAGTHPAGAARVYAPSGTWHGAEKVPGTGPLNQGGNAAINTVSCATVVHCVAGGQYRSGPDRYQAFVVTET
jgi:hypothetical protein